MTALPKVKVCGLTTAEDVHMAHEAGADALGFIAVADTPRSVSAAEVAAICAGLPAGTCRVGVFANSTAAEVTDFAREGNLNAVQLCGDERPPDFEGFVLPILRRIPGDTTGLAELEAWRDLVWGFVIDHPATIGGSGQRVDGDTARAIAGAAPCLLAGGLDESNVSAAIRAVRPAGVDVSSRLEQTVGRKDHPRVRSFVAQAISELELLRG